MIPTVAQVKEDLSRRPLAGATVSRTPYVLLHVLDVSASLGCTIHVLLAVLAAFSTSVQVDKKKLQCWGTHPTLDPTSALPVYPSRV